MRSATKATLITVGVIISVVAVLGIGVVVLEAVGFLILPLVPSYYYRLGYDDMYFDEMDGTVSHGRIGTVSHGYQVPSLYIQLPNDPTSIYLLPQLQEDVLRQIASSERKRELGSKLETRYVVPTGDRAYCEVIFYDGRAAGLYLSGRTGIRISRTNDGEYIELPAKRQDIIRVFGKPLKIERKEAEHIVH